MKRKNRFFLAWFGVLLALSMLSTGCSVLLMTTYLLGGDLTPAEFNGLKGKKVVVVCYPRVQLPVGGRDAAQKIARQVGLNLEKEVSKVEVVNPDKVADWMDTNTFDEYVEIGRAMNADMVVSIDLQEYDIREGQTLLQGKASYELRVTDCKSNKVLFEKTPDRMIWPPNTGVPTMNQSENIFSRKFVNALSEEIARHFYRHDGRSNFAGDITALD